MVAMKANDVIQYSFMGHDCVTLPVVVWIVSVCLPCMISLPVQTTHTKCICQSFKKSVIDPRVCNVQCNPVTMLHGMYKRVALVGHIDGSVPP